MTYQRMNDAHEALNDIPRAADIDTQTRIDRLLADLDALCDETNANVNAQDEAA